MSNNRSLLAELVKVLNANVECTGSAEVCTRHQFIPLVAAVQDMRDALEKIVLLGTVENHILLEEMEKHYGEDAAFAKEAMLSVQEGNLQHPVAVGTKMADYLIETLALLESVDETLFGAETPNPAYAAARGVLLVDEEPVKISEFTIDLEMWEGVSDTPQAVMRNALGLIDSLGEEPRESSQQDA